jgi:hypothetical protein
MLAGIVFQLGKPYIPAYLNKKKDINPPLLQGLSSYILTVGSNTTYGIPETRPLPHIPTRKATLTPRLVE